MTAEPATATGSFTASDGTDLFTRSWMIPEPRYDLLLVHGLNEHSGRFDTTAGRFNAHGANVYSYDIRGHGQTSGSRGDLSAWSDLLSDISEMAMASAASSGRPWVLYGHSVGGLQAAGYLIDHAEPAPNIAVLSAPAMVATRPIDGVLKVACRLLGTVAPSLMISTGVKGDQLSKDPSVGEAYFADEHVELKKTPRFGYAGYGEQDRLSNLMAGITIPTLVIHGANDVIVQPSASAGLAASPAVERKIYPGLSHEMHNEPEAEQVYGEVTDWIEAKLF
ncbi:MAG: lysophospholipase [Acidimicrobiia bacterium]